MPKIATTPTDFEATARSAGPHTIVISLAGELDADTVARLEARLDQVITSTAAEVVIDLADVRFMGCCGVTALIAAQSRLQRQQRRLRLENPSTVVRRLLELTEQTGHL